MLRWSYWSKPNSWSADHSIQLLIQELMWDPNKHLKYSWHRGELRCKCKLFIGANSYLKLIILKWLHESFTGEHSDQDVTTARVKSLFFWRGMLMDIQQQYFKICGICLRCKPDLAGSSWSKWASLAKWWYNTNYHSALHTTPYEVVYGQPPVFICLTLLAKLHNLGWSH